MSNYEVSLKASLDNLSDEEISKKLKAGHFTDEARPVAEQILKERGFASNDTIENNYSHQVVTESPDFLSYEQNKKYIKGNVIVWMVTLFLIGASQLSGSKNIPAFMFFQGLIYAFVGTIIHLIYIKLKKKEWTVLEIKKNYRNNFIGALIVIGLAFISTISRIYFDVASVMAWLDLVVLAIIFIMYINSKKEAKYALAIYSLIPIAIALIFGSNGNTMIWAFGFLVSANSILINEIINPGDNKSA